MKKKLLFPLAMLLSVCFILSCNKDPEITEEPAPDPDPIEEEETEVPEPFISIGDVRDLYQGSAKTISADDIQQASYTGGIVISDPTNAPNGLVVLQNLHEDKLRGIALYVGSNANRYQPGDSLTVQLRGKTLHRVGGALLLSGLSGSDVNKVSEGNEQRIHIVTGTFADVTGNMDRYESTLVELQGAFVPSFIANIGQERLFSVNATLGLSDGTTNILMNTNNTVSFADNQIPLMADYVGVALRNESGNLALRMRSAQDYNRKTYRQYPNFPEGWENASLVGARASSAINGTQTFLSGIWYMNGYTINSGNMAHKTGSFAVMLNSGTNTDGTPRLLAMEFDLPHGASRLSFDYGHAASAADYGFDVTVTVEYSQDGGDTWHPLSEDLLVPTATELIKYTFDQELNFTGPVRFRIGKSCVSGGRLFIDEVAVYQY